MLETSSRASGESPLFSVCSAGATSPLTAFSTAQGTSSNFRTSFNGSNFGDFLDTSNATAFTEHTDTPMAATPAQDFPLFAHIPWHSPGHSRGGICDMYGSYSGQAATGHSPLSDLYTSQPTWLTSPSRNGDEDTQNSSLSPQIMYQRADLGLGGHSPHDDATSGVYFSLDADLPSWSTVPSMDHTPSLQLPSPMKVPKTARISSTAASTKLPQVVTTSHGDMDDFVMPYKVSTRSQGGGELSIASAGHKRGTASGRRSSNKGKDSASASTTTGHEGHNPKPDRSASSGSCSAESGSMAGAKKEFVCKDPLCRSPAFTRMADLERHIRHIHTDADKKEQFLCDYAECSRSSTPFHRKDHYREHLREYHFEDLLKRGSNAHRSTSPNMASASAAQDYKKDKKQKQEEQLQNCKTDASWWRCARCLKRVSIAERGWTCPSCKGSIEEPRKAIRDQRASFAAGDHAVVPSNADMMSTLAATPDWVSGQYYPGTYE
ncbi:hypothetical protein SCUCBS95973_001054 [Sporothrix curviconia]|uniref:C2h2 finger domain containing protein n=1 Tax=Sporothrix curviconia TaxID=1260050 RepID=A0ABP0AVU7_9PEZI